jgi:hypothetical protein
VQVSFTPEADQLLTNAQSFKQKLTTVLKELTIAQSCTVEGVTGAAPGLTIRCDGRPPIGVAQADFTAADTVDKVLARLLAGRTDSTFDRILNNVWPVTWRLGVIVLVVYAVSFIGYVIFANNKSVGGEGRGLDLSDGAFMRGFITTLFLVGSLVLVAIVIMSALFSDDDNSTQRRVTLAREVLAPLFGILGTIVGFYFGSITKESVSATQPTTKSTAPTPPTSPGPSPPTNK